MKILPLVLFVLSLFSVTFRAEGQNIKVTSDEKGIDTDTIPKTILDYPQYRVYYDYVRVTHPGSKPLVGQQGIAVLLIGRTHNAFKDYYKHRVDSILDLSGRERWPSGKGLSMAVNVGRNKLTPDVIVLDRKLKEYTMEVKIPMGSVYTYRESVDDLKWQLVPGDSVVSGYKCKKATTTYRGRSYVAWYTEEIPLPYGPYKFNGLPGLVMRIRDNQKHHTFTFMGMTKAFSTDFVSTNPRAFGGKRAWIRKSLQNYYDNPVKGIESSGTVKLSEEDKRDIKKRPYNPIELE
ncbi:GLPGLI family protein [Porphyromonas cangingivalis]|uniref:GLPGLI family protein n=1 Tax=Porphyromonas cangingivalis TaxID=36874 RepID=UPI0009E08801|nr:GLPGLI family protein [Porphyromonas cangingivalis]